MPPNTPEPSPEQIEAQREAARKMVERVSVELVMNWHHGDAEQMKCWERHVEAVATALARAVLRERERCARLFERVPDYEWAGYEVATVIRRGDDHGA